MTKPLVVTDLGTSEDRRRLRGGKMFNWTIINDMLHLAWVGSNIDSKASWRIKRFSERSNTKGLCHLGGSGSSERRG